MQNTRQIDATEASKYFKMLDENTDLRDEALNCFSTEIISLSPITDATYYIVSDETGEVLFIRTILKKGVSPCIEISFCRISPNSPIKNEWLKTAIEEKILPESIKKDADYISAFPVTHELEVYRQLQNGMPTPIFDSNHNSMYQVEIIPDPGSPSSYRVKLRVRKCK